MRAFAATFRWQVAQALLAGALLPLAYSPIDFWPLQIVSLAWLYLLMQQRTPSEAARLGFAYGVGAFGVGTSWVYVSIHDFGNAPPALAGVITAGFVLLLAGYVALQFYLYRRYCTQRASAIVGFAATWVLGEWLRGWLFTGFPWLYLGYPHVTTFLSGIAPLFGVLGLTFVIALSSAFVGDLVLYATRRNTELRAHWLRTFVALIALWSVSFALRDIAWTSPKDAPPLSVGLVQGNVEQNLKFDPAHLQDGLNRYASLSSTLWENDLVVWPETAIPLVYQREPDLIAQLNAQASANNATLISGVFFQTPDAVHNSLATFGDGSGVWHKQKLVPFGEYVPLRNVLSTLLQLFALPQSSLQPGPDDQMLLAAGPHQIAAFICYEVVYPDFVRYYGRDADLLLTVSNDTWFGASWGPHQHLQMATMRARELGRHMVRATNNGISALIDERGAITATVPQFTATVLQGEVRLFEGSTPFARWGSWPVLLLSIAVLMAAALRNRTPR